MTDVHQILDEYFSSSSRERKWIMRESNDYTAIVREWSYVIDVVNEAKADLQRNCGEWNEKHRTDTTWEPWATDTPNVDADPHAFRRRVQGPNWDTWSLLAGFHYLDSHPSPFIGAPYARLGPMASERQRHRPSFRNLHLSAIGSFEIFVTVDTIDCEEGSATMNIWMYNLMNRSSFNEPQATAAFAAGQQPQYMWWNWRETVSWDPE